MSNILEQYNKYYKVQFDYQQKIDKKIKDKKIKDPNWPYPEDLEGANNYKLSSGVKEEIKKVKGICKGCKEPDMTFSDKNRVLQAKCSAENNCGFELSIPLPNVYQFDKIKQNLKNEIEFLKKEIIRWKLNLLYKLDNEEVVLREFQVLKDKMIFNQKKLNKIISIQNKKFNFTAASGEDQEKSTLDEIVQKYEININLEKHKFKNLIHDFSEDTTQTTILNAAMEKYIKIRESIEQKREIEFKLGNIKIERPKVNEKWTGKWVLIKEKLSYNNQEIDNN
jgi:hypothetical protein